MTPSRRVRIASLAVVLAAFPAALMVPGMETGLLILSPAILLLASLLCGHYVGEKRLHRLAAAVRGRRPLMPRGGRPVATSLAVRPPPLPATVR